MKEKERERESLKKKERKFKDTKKYAVGLSNLLGNVARRELTSWEEKWKRRAGVHQHRY